MRTCRRCCRAYPEHLVNDIWIGSEYKPVCGVCALRLSRIEHDNRELEFRPGSKARAIYDETLAIDQQRRAR